MAEYHLFQSIKTHCQGKTLVFISHRLSSTIHADKIYVFENGQIIEAGNHNTLMAQKGAYFNMFTKQAEKYLNDEKQVKSHEA
jgi:ATP-binding cassette subfamily B protein